MQCGNRDHRHNDLCCMRLRRQRASFSSLLTNCSQAASALTQPATLQRRPPAHIHTCRKASAAEWPPATTNAPSSASMASASTLEPFCSGGRGEEEAGGHEK